ncbi:VOC family protein [Amycolatopsis cynarae]|uniref:VOC family protein n=1 Tax=Amycolatopsis cynarae TaxID=2995223 RepID=A0ABY7B0P3_9PSEU|nr:VOC family protein [Amycolatopsis sp. HUAS 11-8]WAL65861.1 VOC family protein [Amycolatopsis sp. HUAS 11-8]
MRITSSAVSLNVDDVAASSRFLRRHFGFTEQMAADGFASLAREDAGLNVIFLSRGLPTLPADQRDIHAAGLILAFVVDDLEGELERLQREGVTITAPDRRRVGRAGVPGPRSQRRHRPAGRLEGQRLTVRVVK